MNCQASRDGPTNKVRARMSIASAIIFGSVFWRMGRSQTSIQDRMGLLQVKYIVVYFTSIPFARIENSSLAK